MMKPDLQFAEELKAEPEVITCSESDINWHIDIPEIKHQDQFKADITLDPLFPPNYMFTLDSDMKVLKIRLAPTIRQTILKDKKCPPNGDY